MNEFGEAASEVAAEKLPEQLAFVRFRGLPSSRVREVDDSGKFAAVLPEQPELRRSATRFAWSPCEVALELPDEPPFVPFVPFVRSAIQQQPRPFGWSANQFEAGRPSLGRSATEFARSVILGRWTAGSTLIHRSITGGGG